jgi:hypothetical protein
MSGGREFRSHPFKAHRLLLWVPAPLQDTAALVAAGANSLPLAGQGPLVTTATVAWAAAVLLSRAFSLDMSDEEGGGSGDGGGGGWQQQGDVLALVPWADLADLTAGQEGGCLGACSLTRQLKGAWLPAA